MKFSKFKDLDPKFRELTDLLLLSYKMDLDLSHLKKIFKSPQRNLHIEYLLSQFEKSSLISWEQSEFWSSRFNYLFDLKEREISRYIKKFCEKEFFSALGEYPNVKLTFMPEFIQFKELCKIKSQRKENFFSIKLEIAKMTNWMTNKKLFEFIKEIIPYVFKDFDDYINFLIKGRSKHYNNFDILLTIEKYGIPFDKSILLKLTQDIVTSINILTDHNVIYTFFSLLKDSFIRQSMKDKIPSNKLSLILRNCDPYELEHSHYQNMKNLIEFCPIITDELVEVYIDKLYGISSLHKRKNIDKLIKIIRMFPQISTKLVLSKLSSKNKPFDLKILMLEFPDLKKLAAFI